MERESLENKHRFQDDSQYGKMLEQFRTGHIKDSTFDKINSRLVGCNGVAILKHMHVQQIRKEIR